MITEIRTPKTRVSQMEAKSTWVKDLSASLVVFLVALPLCMGIAIASGMPPARGLVTGIIGGIVVGLFSGSPLQVSGPAAGLAVLVFELVHDHGIGALGPILMLAGAMQFIAGVLKVGRWFRAISPEVVHGMLAGIGVLIVIQQFHVVLDRAPKANGPANIYAMGEAVFGGLFPLNGSREEFAFLVGAVTLVVMLLWNRVRPEKLKLVPAALLGIGAGTAVAQFMHLDVNRIKVPATLGDMVSFTTVASFNTIGWGAMLGTAAALAFIASAETLLSAAAVDQMQAKVRADYDKELSAQGIGNMLCGFLGALPMTGVIVRSSANVQAGAETRKSTILHGVWILVSVVFLAGILRLIPMASLGAVLVLTGIKLVKPKDIMHLRRFGWAPVIVYMLSMITIVATNLLTGVLLGIGLSLLWTLWKLTHLQAAVEEASDRTVIHFSGVGTFLAIPKISQTLDQIRPGIPVHIHAIGLRYVDHACIEIIEAWVERWQDQGHVVHIELEQLHRRYQTPVSESVS
ncbi:SulP family inorganic anion transporter [Terriglobus saanensis]|uniref:Sulphate transporter n=1 Tax=Terriglobus saanensis (strain ATCC BAA-1853 / DSM 23119 / SP1PR4) TaxID=401053 RepID=E8V6B9_TERSS|nr:SulP family inorganic anion transporter [Terriglobus saanensis]ADV81584.1 sulphate transporter [Terriglobus saanensis SP1PR4]